MNTMKTTLLLASLSGLFLFVGAQFGGHNGLVIALLFTGVMNFVSYWFSDKIVLAMYRATEVTEADAPKIYRIVRRLCDRNALPMPKVYVIPGEMANAFATGRSPRHASVAATEGIIAMLSESELEGVMAHELAHVQNRDTLTSTIAATLAGAITYLAHIVQWGAMFSGGGSRDDNDRGSMAGTLALAFIAPMAAMLIQLAISRSREYVADATGARYCGNPMALANALSKLENSAVRRPLTNGNAATASLFIVNPFRGSVIFSLFSTHPPMEKRIAKLQDMARGL